MSILEKAVLSIQESEITFTKFITANDTGATGGHQSGYHIHKNAWPILFNSEGEKGKNKEKLVTIRWQDEFETSSRFIYYGRGTRNEYRITRFGQGFPFLTDENVGDLLVLIKKTEDFYEAFVFSHDEDIEGLFDAVNISPSETSRILPKQFGQTAEEKLLRCFASYVELLGIEFPSTLDLAIKSRECYINSYKITKNQIKSEPDKQIIEWLDAEYDLFRLIESNVYSEIIKTPFGSVEALVKLANTILQRRKSRAGKSLELHLEEIFNVFELIFQTQPTTENNKKPDFLFPGVEQYHDLKFNEEKLFLLASKRTCKDRWRQVLNEADRIRTKHLFTLQEGVSKNQLEEMRQYGVQLVVPKSNLSSFPSEYREYILTLNQFIQLVLTKQR